MSLSVFRAAREAPDRPALVRDGVVLSWGELAGRVRKAVGWLRHHGVESGAEAPVAVIADVSPPVVEMLHALIALGVPMHLLHPRLSDAERDAFVARAHPLLVVGADWHESMGATGVAVPDPPDVPDDDRTLAVVYTSGTSGTAKGVVLGRRAFVASARASAANLGWQDDDRWLLRLPLAHIGGLSILTRCLLDRRAVALAAPADGDAGAHAPPGRELAGAIERTRATLLSLVPTQLARLLDLDPEWSLPDHVRAILLGGAPASADLLERAFDRGWPVLTTYGMSETCSQVTTQPYGTVNRGGAGAGRPLPGVQVRLVDEEIQVRGPMLFSGYFPGALPEALLPDGWFPTGDRGRFDDDGNLHVTGRHDDLIVSGGENVDPLEIEEALRACPGVDDACVFGLPDPEWGARVCAAVVAEPGASVDPAELDAELRERLAGFKRPRDYALVDELPRNALGKLDRRAAAERFAGRMATLGHATDTLPAPDTPPTGDEAGSHGGTT